MKIKSLIIFIFFAMRIAIAASPESSPALPINGVQIHFAGGHEKELDMISAAGFKVVRNGLYWDRTEIKKGVYDWSKYDQLLATLRARHLKLIFTLYSSNKLYVNGPIPKTDEEIKGFSNWAAAAALHFRGNDIIWEIWNEPNLVSFWGGNPNPSEYSRLLNSTCHAIRSVVPEGIIYGGALGASSSEDKVFSFLDIILNKDASTCLSGITLHPYRKSPPETVSSYYSRFREKFPQFPVIVSGEWGYSTGGKAAITENQQAAYLARSFLVNSANSIPISIWYDFTDDGDDNSNAEHRFGLIKRNLSPKASYLTASLLNETLSGYHFEGRCKVKNNEEFSYVFSRNGTERILAAWANSDNSSSVWSTEILDGPIRHGDGSIKEIDKSQKNTTLTLSNLPQYIKLKSNNSPPCEFTNR